MKHSNIIGCVSAIALMAFCLSPWVYISSISTIITGFKTTPTNFGTPGIVHFVCAIAASLFFMLNKIWAKRINVFICTLNLAWSLRNFILLSRCEAGECPEKRFGIYAIVFLSCIMLLMSLLPKMKMEEKSNEI